MLEKTVQSSENTGVAGESKDKRVVMREGAVGSGVGRASYIDRSDTPICAGNKRSMFEFWTCYRSPRAR